MKNRKHDFLIYLNGRNFENFVNYIANNKQLSIMNIIEILVNSEINEIDFFRLKKLAEYIFIEISGRHFGEEIHFEIDQNLEYFQEMMYFFNVFSLLEIPFNKWKKLVIILYEMLRDFIKTNNFNYKKDPKYKDFLNEKEKIISEIRKDPEIDRKYLDFLNGAF